MNDMSKTIIPKSDQLNADDLIAGPMTVKVTNVSVAMSGEQPASIFFEGDNGKPFKPCKSMRRVLVKIWGSDGNKYAGRSMTLYCDPNVKWAGEKVGGIRISHMSDMKEKVEMALTATRGSRKPYTVFPLAVAGNEDNLVNEGAEAAERGTEKLKSFWERLKKPQQQKLLTNMESWKKRAAEIDAAGCDVIIE